MKKLNDLEEERGQASLPDLELLAITLHSKLERLPIWFSTKLRSLAAGPRSASAFGFEWLASDK